MEVADLTYLKPSVYFKEPPSFQVQIHKNLSIGPFYFFFTSNDVNELTFYTRQSNLQT